MKPETWGESVIAENIERIRRRMSAACLKAGRAEGEVRIVAVSKKVVPALVTEAFECGLEIMGESRVQEARQKMALCPGAVEWHMIGHLQTNKVKDIVRFVRMIHSVDSLKLLECIDIEAGKAGLTMPVCIEVNVSGESSKFGLPPEAVPGILKAGTGMMNVDIIGLMTIPPFTEDPEGARPYFVRLRGLRDELRGETGFDLGELSMGMSHDFEVAVEEGSTMVRIGTDIFGERQAGKE